LLSKLFSSVFDISINDERGLARFVVVVTGACVTVALAVDIANQLIFFEDWSACFRSWTVTLVLVLVLAIPISRVIGKAHLELYRAKLLAETLGRTDQLTGLPNRRALIERVQADGPKILALVIVDIDWFKRVNDAHGHLAGDAVIRAVGQTMANDLGALGMVARIGGEEFALISSQGSEETVSAELSRFRDKIGSTPIIIEGAALRVTISAGVAVRRGDETFDSLFSQADHALYVAKKSGRNRVSFAGGAPGASGRPSEKEPEELGVRPDRRSARRSV
jgi:diguanylate cyclase (GGDEF)-like protein